MTHQRHRTPIHPAWLLVPLLSLGAGDIESEQERAVEREAQQPATWQFAFTPNFSSGNYGTGTNTSIVYVPFSMQRLFADGDVSLVVPFVSVTGDGSVTLLSGVPNRQTQISTTQGPRITEMGLGDLVLRGRYYVVDERDWLPTVALTGRVKIPTANESQGLGTGQFDEGVGVELSRTLGKEWTLFVDGSYTFIGKPPGQDLRNQWYYSLGAGYAFSTEWTLSAFYEQYRAVIQGNQSPQDILVVLNYGWSQRMGLVAFTQIGLSDGAPAYALSLGVSYKY
jgi:hypothetical protein